MGCSVIGAVVLPLWLVVAASALYLVPGLGGDWMLDPATGDVSFVYFSPMVLAVRGGLVGALTLAMGTPLISLGFLLFSGAGMLGRRRARFEAHDLNEQVGRAALDGELVVRKRSKTGRTAHAIPISVGAASALRRLLARGFDLALLSSTVLGAALFGVLLDTAGVGWEGLTQRTPLLFALAAGASLQLVQWLGVADRGQTLGKILFDIRLAQKGEQHRPGLVSGLFLRHVLFETLEVWAAAFGAWLSAAVLAATLAQSEYSVLFVIFALREVMTYVLWPLLLAGLQAARSLPLLFAGTQGLHDWVSGTWVVRTAVGERVEEAVPLGYRILARAIDGLLVLLAAGLPLSAEAVRLTVLGGEPGWITAGVAFVSTGLGLVVLLSQWMQLVGRGDTVGKRVLGIEVVPLEGERTFQSLVVVREWLAFGGLILALGPFGPVVNGALALSDDRRAIHDQLAGTRVRWRG